MIRVRQELAVPTASIQGVESLEHEVGPLSVNILRYFAIEEARARDTSILGPLVRQHNRLTSIPVTHKRPLLPLLYRHLPTPSDHKSQASLVLMHIGVDLRAVPYSQAPRLRAILRAHPALVLTPVTLRPRP
jgi:hypothetical protein